MPAPSVQSEASTDDPRNMMPARLGDYAYRAESAITAFRLTIIEALYATASQ